MCAFAKVRTRIESSMIKTIDPGPLVLRVTSVAWRPLAGRECSVRLEQTL